MKDGNMKEKAMNSEAKAERMKGGMDEKKEKSKFKISKGKSFARGKR